MMKKIKFDGVTGDRYLCSNANINVMIKKGKDFTTIAHTSKGTIIELKKR